MAGKPRVNSEYRILLKARDLCEQGGGFVSRTHLRQALGIGITYIDELLRRHNIPLHTIPQPGKGRPVTVLDLHSVTRVLDTLSPDEPAVAEAKVLKELDRRKWLLYAERVIRIACEMSAVVGYVQRSYLKQRLNTVHADDIDLVMDTFDVQLVRLHNTSVGMVYHKDHLIRALDKITKELAI